MCLIFLYAITAGYFKVSPEIYITINWDIFFIWPMGQDTFKRNPSQGFFSTKLHTPAPLDIN